jgi:hypothetical protein
VTTIAVAAIAAITTIISVALAADAYLKARRYLSDNWLQAQREQYASNAKQSRDLGSVIRDLGGMIERQQDEQ